MKITIVCDKGKPNLCLSVNRDLQIVASAFSFSSVKVARSRVVSAMDMFRKRGSVLTLKDFDPRIDFEKLRRALVDEMTRLSLVDALYWRPVTNFERRVYLATLSIPMGEIRTYGEIAEELGTSARAVGQALARNPFSPIIPCHRVVGKSGLGGFAGSKDARDKKKMIEFERVVAEEIEKKKVLRWK